MQESITRGRLRRYCPPWHNDCMCCISIALSIQLQQSHLSFGNAIRTAFGSAVFNACTQCERAADVRAAALLVYMLSGCRVRLVLCLLLLAGPPKPDIWVPDSEMECFTSRDDWRHLGLILSASRAASTAHL